MRVVVVPYNEEWGQQFEEEAKRLREIFQNELMDIHHIGSTSVPGLQAKPIIDIMPVIRRIEQVDAYNVAMETIGYQCFGEYGIPGRRHFNKKGERNIHMFQHGDPNIERHLAFRDYLRTHPQEAANYGSLKVELSQKFSDDFEAYMDGKDALIREIEEKTLAWHRQISQ